MSLTRAWLEARAGRHRPSLDLALLTEAGSRYARSRIAIVSLRAIVRTAVHIAEVWFLAREFPLEFLFPLFALRAAPALVSGLHWGALEGLRARVRGEASSRSKAASVAVTEGYLVVTFAAACALSGLVTLLIASDSDPIRGPLGLYGLFAIVCALATSIALWTRTYHAGVFALGRVYRPTWSLFLPDLVELVGIVALWPLIGPFCLHAVVLLGAILQGGIAVIYAARAYRVRGMPRPRLFRGKSLALISISDARAATLHLLATFPMQLDRLLLLALLHAPPLSGAAIAIGLPYYALRPIAGFAHSWVRTFYADFVRLDASGAGMLRVRFERLLSRTAIAMGALSAIAFAVGAYALFELPGLVAGAWLAPLLLIRSRFALDQVRGFVYGAHTKLAITGAILLGGVLSASYLNVPDRSLLLLVTATLLGAIIVGRRIHSRASERRSERGTRLPLSAWLAAVSARTQPVRICVVRVDTRITPLGPAQVVVGNALVSRGHVTRLGRAWLLWWESADTARSTGDWVRDLGGAIAQFDSVIGKDGAEALDRARHQRILPRDLLAALAEAAPSDATLRKAAAQLVPSSEVIDLRSTSQALDGLPAQTLALVRHAIFAGAREQHLRSKASWQVAVYAPAGETNMVWIWPCGAEGGGELRRKLQQASWRASLTRQSRS